MTFDSGLASDLSPGCMFYYIYFSRSRSPSSSSDNSILLANTVANTVPTLLLTIVLDFEAR